MENNERLEPYEELTIDVNEEYMGRVIESLGLRKGQLLDINQDSDMTRIKYLIPTRGLLGYHDQFMTETKGMGTMNYVFAKYGPFAGELKTRKNGVMIVKDTSVTVAFALFNIQERGDLFLGPGNEVYAGQIIGECSREGDMVVNPAKGKKLTNMRASGTDEAVTLVPPRLMSLEQCISYINDDELVEVTPKNIRIRKLYLDENERRKRER
jgi:GTP-binding protein